MMKAQEFSTLKLFPETLEGYCKHISVKKKKKYIQFWTITLSLPVVTYYRIPIKKILS